MLKKLFFAVFVSLLGPEWAFSEQIISSQFFGVNNNSNASIIDPTEAQDSLNTDVSITGN